MDCSCGVDERKLYGCRKSYVVILETGQEMSSAHILDKNIKTQTLGLVYTFLSFDFVVALYFMKNIMHIIIILTEQLKTIDLNVIDT